MGRAGHVDGDQRNAAAVGDPNGVPAGNGGPGQEFVAGTRIAENHLVVVRMNVVLHRAPLLRSGTTALSSRLSGVTRISIDKVPSARTLERCLCPAPSTSRDR